MKTQKRMAVVLEKKVSRNIKRFVTKEFIFLFKLQVVNKLLERPFLKILQIN